MSDLSSSEALKKIAELKIEITWPKNVNGDFVVANHPEAKFFSPVQLVTPGGDERALCRAVSQLVLDLETSEG